MLSTQSAPAAQAWRSAREIDEMDLLEKRNPRATQRTVIRAAILGAAGFVVFALTFALILLLRSDFPAKSGPTSPRRSPSGSNSSPLSDSSSSIAAPSSQSLSEIETPQVWTPDKDLVNNLTQDVDVGD